MTGLIVYKIVYKTVYILLQALVAWGEIADLCNKQFRATTKMEVVDLFDDTTCCTATSHATNGVNCNNMDSLESILQLTMQ